ncbi:TolC family outer membrane protein [Ideonella sp. DXS29W]|uniref:TolC family outer membrane protein n=1 Tax=Ideonella lacteola TaxID=2984193 RepID=A0ABU9BUY9_9BURK
MRLRLVIATLALGLGSATRAEDLLQVYAQARAADPVLAAADAQLGIQREAAAQARAALLPQWQLSATETRDQQDGSRSRTLGSGISQTLFDLGRLRTWDAERALESAQDLRVRAAEQALCARVATAYFGVLSAQAALATTQANEEAFSAQVAQAQKRFEAGLSAQVDVDQARAYHALARGATQQARQLLADAREALAELTGHPPGELKPLSAALPATLPQPAQAQDWVDAALNTNPQLLAQARVVDASEQRIGAARAAHWPTFSAGVESTRHSGAGVSEDQRVGGTQLTLRLTVPLFAGGASQSQVRQAGYQRDLARDDYETARRALVRETQAQYHAVVSGVFLLDSSRAAVAAADQALASTRAGQGLGTRSMTDLLLAIQTQAAAQNAHDEARHGYVLARLLLLQAAGALGEPELAAVNQLLGDH